MTRLRKSAIVVLVACLCCSTACSLRRDRTPTITVDGLQTRAGLALKVIGQNWEPGEQVTIGLNPQEPALSLGEVWVVAHSSESDRVAIATFTYSSGLLATATLVPAITGTPPAVPPSSVLGYVEQVSASARVINIKPIEGQAEVIALADNAQILSNEMPALLTDILIGDLIEATGDPSPLAANTLIATRIRVLVRATVEPTPTPTPTRPALTWKGEYYNNTTFSGTPSLVRDDPVIDFQWQNGGPGEGLPTDGFAVRWTGSWPFEAGVHRFFAQVNDGVRLWLDEHMIIDQWHESIGSLYSADAELSAGPHTVRIEYFDGQESAHVRVWWEYRGLDATSTYLDWKGEYYANMSLGGSPFLVVNDRVLDFDWGKSSPAAGMPADEVSARWTRNVTLDEGTYRFYARADDGVRLWVDDNQVIDHWQDGGAEDYAGDAFVSSGEHTIRVEYYENGGLAVIRVWWERVAATPTPTETPTATPTLTPESPTDTPLPATPTATETLPPATLTPTPTVTAGTTSVQPSSSFGLYFSLAGTVSASPRVFRRPVLPRLGGPAAAS
jgi:hypothetical protein